MSSRGSARAAQTSQPGKPGEPSVIESPRAATTIRSLILAWIRLLRDQPCHAFLADEVVLSAPLDDLFHLRRLVPRVHGELVRVRAKLLVLAVGHADALQARGVAALADQVERLRTELEGLGQRLDALVHLAEDGLVQADALFTPAHVPRFSTTT